MTVVMVVMSEKRWTVDGVGDTFGYTLNTTTEAVVVTVVVVISHITLEFGGIYGGTGSPLSDTDSSISGWAVNSCTSEAGFFLAKVLSRDAESVLGSTNDGAGTFTELTFGNIKSGIETTCSRTDGVEGSVVGTVVDLLLNVGGTTFGFLEAVGMGVSKKETEKRIER
jgi:hypothetical protein